MFIYSLNLENVKSYKNASFAFTEGVNAIVGRNGAGKSTIVESIGYALFDSGSGRALVRQGAPSGQITVEFQSSLDQRRYRVVRRTSTGWFIHDVELNARLQSGTADVKAFLREHMGLSSNADLSKVFEDAVGVPQGKITAIFSESHRVRKAVFDPLLEVEEYDTAFQNLLETRNLLRERIGATSIESSRIDGVLEQLPVVSASLEDLKKEIQTGERDFAAATTRLQKASDERKKWEERRREFVEAQRAHQSASALAERTTDLRDAALRALEEARKADAIVKEHQTGYEQHMAARSEREALERDAQLRQKLLLEENAAKSESQKAQESIARIGQELEEVARQEKVAAELEADVQREEQLRAAYEKARTAAQQLKMQRDALSRLENANRDECARLEMLRAESAKAVTLQQQIADALAAERALQERSEQASVEMNTRKALAESVKEQSAVLQTAEANGQAACPVCEQPLTANHVHSLRQRNDARVQQLRDEWAGLKNQVSRFEEERAVLQKSQREWGDALAKLPTAAMIEQVEQRIADLEEQKQGLQSEIDALEKAAQPVAALEADLRAVGEPRVARAVALRIVERRPNLEREREEAKRSLDATTKRMQALSADLAAFVDLDTRLQKVVETERTTQTAWQQVIANQQSAAQLPLRQEAAAAAEQALAQAMEAHASAVEQLRLVESEYDETLADSARVEESLAQSEVGALTSRLEMQRIDCERLSKQKAQLLELQREQQALRVTLEKMKHQGDVLEMMRATIKAAGPQITRALIGQVGAYASQWFGELTGDFSRRLAWDEEYAITLEQDGRQLEFKMLSGGEQMVAALSVRLALLRELGKIDIAFFDEPTAHLDVERRESLAKQIMQVKGFRQLFVISHDDTFEHQTDNLIHVERAHEGSRVLVA